MPKKAVTTGILSENRDNSQQIFDKLIDVMDRVKNRTISVDQANSITKAGYAASKLIESDLHARMLQHKLDAPAPRQMKTITE